MKRIQLQQYGAWWADPHLDLVGYCNTWLCDDTLRQYVNLPKNTKKIWLVGSTRPFREAYKVTFDLLLSTSLDGHRVTLLPSLRQWINEHNIKYIGIEYEA